LERNGLKGKREIKKGKKERKKEMVKKKYTEEVVSHENRNCAQAYTQNFSLAGGWLESYGFFNSGSMYNLCLGRFQHVIGHEGP
jgi:hypothetical protein